jgi:hypothetical protein
MRAPNNVLPGMAMANAMTIDVEDYFQVSALAPYIARNEWDTLDGASRRTSIASSRCWTSTARTRRSFTLGWIAERYPGLIRRIVAERP